MKKIIFLTIILFVLGTNSSFSFINFDSEGKWSTSFEYGQECVKHWKFHDEIGYCKDVANDGATWTGYPQAYQEDNHTIENLTHISASAANSGGYGARFWNWDGVNSHTPTVGVIFPSPQTELWIRWYIRYQEGYRWEALNYEKNLYIYTADRYPAVITGALNDTWYIASSGLPQIGQSQNVMSNKTWADVMGGPYSHGQFLAIEVYLKMNSALGVADGVARKWINGELVLDRNDLQHSGTNANALSGWMNFGFNENQSEVGNQRGPIGINRAYIDYDDMVVYNLTPPNLDAHGYPFIGPMSWGSVPVTTSLEAQPITEPKSFTISGLPTKGDLLLTENFQDNNWSSRGWYDATDSTGVTSGGYSGNALRWDWMAGATKPTGFSTIRRIMAEPVEEFILEYYVKYDSGWRGSGLAYHPHTLHMVSSEDTIYQGGANSNSALYFSQVSGTSAPYAIQPRFGHQDSMRVNTSFGTPRNDLTSTTEDRSANLCNTPLAAAGADYGDCYSMGGGAYYSFSGWRSPSVVVPNDQWVKLTYYVKSNTVANGTANYDGIVKVWVNEALAISNESALLVAGGYGGATWDKFMMAPYIGNGSPVNQTMWLDEMRVWRVAEGSAGVVAPTPLLRLVQ
ncbi:hypothetical protein [Pelovirga terrestris]|uniref:Uncharacterized protein n=1 Tax=Pelovirga terrestris TaxID=2771352 RepID=A0A8J6UG99_9BACT|nr:hypothetical protein [Pelovirga terrestris]MBD1399343.1 hypothetical protein [Pelovirga terrestris]